MQNLIAGSHLNPTNQLLGPNGLKVAAGLHVSNKDQKA